MSGLDPIEYANITKLGHDKNWTVSEALAATQNNGEEAYAMADNVKVIKIAGGHKEIPFKSTDIPTKIQNGTTSVECAPSADVSILPPSGSKIKVTDDVIISPVTDDGTKDLIIGNGVSPATNGEYLQLSQDLVRLRSTDASTKDNFIDVSNNEVKGIVTDGAGNSSFLVNNGSSNLSSGAEAIYVVRGSGVYNTNSIAQYDAGADTTTVNKGILEDKITGPFPYVDLETGTADPADQEGRVFWNDYDQTVQVFTNNPNYRNIQGQADFIRVINKTGAPVVRGQNLDARGVGAVGPNFALEAYNATACDIANTDDKGWAVVVATEDIAVDGNGVAAFGGTLLNVPTTGLTVGKPVYLGASGEWTNTRPDGCAKYILMGTCIVEHATAGVIGIRVTTDDYDVEFDATILERQEYEIVAGTGVDANDVIGELYCDVWNKYDPTRNLPVPIGGTTYQLNTTTGDAPLGRARVKLTQGTSTLAQRNKVYVYESGGEAVLATTIGYPTPPFAQVARVSPWTTAKFATDGVLANRRTTSAKVVENRGIISYILERLGVLSPYVYSGCTPTASITANVMNLTSDAGIVYQTLRQSMPAIEVITDGFYVANGPNGAGLDNNAKFTDIVDVCGYTSVDEARDTSCTGSLVFYLLINKTEAECKIMCNLPKELDGTNGSSGLRTYRNDRNVANFTGREETSYTEFSLCRIPYRYSGGTIQFLDPDGAGTTDGQYIISRLNEPMGSAGGSGGGGGGLQNLAQVLGEGNDAGGQDIVNVAQINTGNYYTNSIVGALEFGINMLGCEYVGGAFLATQTSYAPFVTQLTSLGAFEIFKCTIVPTSIGQNITTSLVQISRVDSNSIQTLPEANNTNIDLAGAKAVTTVEFCDDKYVASSGAWVDATVSGDIDDNWENVNTESPLSYTKTGNIVNIAGSIKPAAGAAAGDSIFLELPAGYLPRSVGTPANHAVRGGVAVINSLNDIGLIRYTVTGSGVAYIDTSEIGSTVLNITRLDVNITFFTA